MGRLLRHHLEKELSRPDCTFVVELNPDPQAQWAGPAEGGLQAALRGSEDVNVPALPHLAVACRSGASGASPSTSLPSA